MSTVVISAYDVANYPEGGGHFWVYMQYVEGLRRLGCEVYWLENLRRRGDPAQDAANVGEFAKRMDRFGMGGNFILYEDRKTENGDVRRDYIGMSVSKAETIFRRADLLLNFHYAIDPAVLSLFPRTALVDIDPGLLQTWISVGQLTVPKHDVYFTIGETVGTTSALFSDCGITWRHIHPPVCLQEWPAVPCRECEAFTTVSAWWSTDWLTDGNGDLYDNNKRVTFLQFLELPRLTSQVLELALYFGPRPHDVADRCLLEQHGWRVRHSLEVAKTPEMYRAYIHQSRGEFGCAKPAYVRLQTAWVSDRTLCYLASGKPVVIQHTGASSFLPNGEGMFRYSTAEEAAAAFATINRDYARHCRAAREIAEAYFDSKQVAMRILDHALSPTPQSGNSPRGAEEMKRASLVPG